jgi:predicted lipoprotein with Yx(FWY)xxD motif
LTSRRIALALTLATAAGLAAGATVLAAPSTTSPRPPVIKLKNDRFGFILATRRRLPLYYWSVEKRAGRNQIRCTGDCARVWPPVLLRRGQTMPARLRGVRGRFGVVRRPDGRRQVTHNGRPLYSYHNDPPNTVLCNNVDGWFVVRVTN